MARRRYATMDGCPVRGCQDPLKVTRGTKPTVVGVKRHVRHWHPEKYDRIKWPDIYEVPAGRKVAAQLRGSKPRDPLSGRSMDFLRQQARKKGINPRGMRKDELVKALSA